MKSTSESLSHPETSNGKAAGGNCVVARRGGEQPEAALLSGNLKAAQAVRVVDGKLKLDGSAGNAGD